MSDEQFVLFQRLLRFRNDFLQIQDQLQIAHRCCVLTMSCVFRSELKKTAIFKTSGLDTGFPAFCPADGIGVLDVRGSFWG